MALNTIYQYPVMWCIKTGIVDSANHNIRFFDPCWQVELMIHINNGGFGGIYEGKDWPMHSKSSSCTRW